MTLDALGWRPRFAEAFEAFRGEGVEPARVSLEHTHIYRVIAASGEHLARVAGRLRHAAEGRADFPAVGDWVVLERPPAGNTTEKQVVAANIDVVFLVSGLDRDFNPRRIERYLVTAWDSGASPVIVLNKTDLVDDPDTFIRDVEALASGVPVVAVSAKRPESLAALRDYVGEGRTAALLGMSGVGKSSIANGLIGEEVLRTREVREHDSRGRHTTTGRQLVPLPGGGILSDTPGMRELQLWDTGEPVAGAFADIDALAEGCRFRDCRHASEPGCAVIAAVADGALAEARLESFRKLQAEQAYQATQQDERARLEVKRRWKVLTKAAEKRIREKGR